MNDYIAKGYAVKLSTEESAHTSKCTWYLPHHGVINPNKARVRVLYDAAAEFGGTSLNKELLQGPQLNNYLVGVLIRFRKEDVAVASDIESMFHRVVCFTAVDGVVAKRELLVDKVPVQCQASISCYPSKGKNG